MRCRINWENRFNLSFFGILDGTDHGELAVAQYLDVVFEVGDVRFGHGVAVEGDVQLCQTPVNVGAWLVAAGHLEDLAKHEDVVPCLGYENDGSLFAGHDRSQRAALELLHKFAEGAAFVVSALVRVQYVPQGTGWCWLVIMFPVFFL